MAKEIILSIDDDKAYGLKKEFESEDDFKYSVVMTIDFPVKITSIQTERCIYSQYGLEADMIVPLSEVNIEIDEYYTCSIDEVVDNEE